jgi:hypothetical protein
VRARALGTRVEDIFKINFIYMLKQSQIYRKVVNTVYQSVFLKETEPVEYVCIYILCI